MIQDEQLHHERLHRKLSRSIITLLLLWHTTGYCQPNITRVEYYLDTDPGKGLATGIPITPAQNLSSISVSVPVGSLSQGVHIMGVRSQDANGAWSLDNGWVFLKPYTSLVAGPVPNIVRVEYYIDTDPGRGLATNVPVIAATDISGIAVTVPVSSLSQGVHIMGVRSQDANGAWSLDNAWIFLKPYLSLLAGPFPAITRLEYYVDTDPGLGMATSIPLTSATDISGLSATLSLPALNDSAHTLYVRSQDANGAWSLDNAFSFTFTGILPVTLLDFTAVLTPQQYTFLQWSTSAEENSAYYNVQRTSDGLHFSNIGKVRAGRQQQPYRQLHLYRFYRGESWLSHRFLPAAGSRSGW